MNFSERLKEAGVDTEEINENLRISAVSIAKDLNVIVGNQDSVTINGETLSVASELQKSIEGSNVLGIEYNSPTANDRLPLPDDNGEDGEI